MTVTGFDRRPQPHIVLGLCVSNVVNTDIVRVSSVVL